MSDHSIPPTDHVYTLGTIRCHSSSTEMATDVGPGWSVFQGDEARAGMEGAEDREPARRTGWMRRRARNERPMLRKWVRRR